jgi:site-specific DNA-methyltransferase (adenine-specific)
MRDLSEQTPAPFVLHLGDCLAIMRGMASDSVDAIVTDPPYELGFMGKSWDASGIANSVDMWREALRVLKPGGHLLAFSGSRTYHRMTVAIEDAGFEIRDQIMWVYGSGFPKSQNISKAIDKQAGTVREVISEGKAVKRMIPGADQDATGSWIKDNGREYVPQVTRAATPEAEQWEGWGTALKPAHEPICVARKPLEKGLTVAANVLKWGTGAINIDGCRVEVTDAAYARNHSGDRGHGGTRGADQEGSTNLHTGGGSAAAGRWPANLIHEGSDEVVALFPETTSGAMKAGTRRAAQDGPGSVCYGTYGGNATSVQIKSSSGSAARFFYCAKASRGDRNEGCASSVAPAVANSINMRECEDADWSARNDNFHPTVKPTDLMAYLVRLVTPPGGVVLDLFMGSGSTGKACMREGFQFIGIDMTPEYVEIARARIEHEATKAMASASDNDAPVPQRDLFEEAA